MAKFLATEGITHHLTEIIKNTERQLLLISPYLKFSQRIREELEDQDKLRRAICVVYGKKKLQLEESDWLAKTGIRRYFRKNLHAKCYMNESQALITSMNLYEFSQQNNDEMGILVSAKGDPDLYKDIDDYAQRVLRLSEDMNLRVTRIESGNDDHTRGKTDAPARSEPQTALPETGFCLRCGTEIPCDPEKPYCNSHNRSWARFKNESYEEKHCHTCGNDHSSSMAKPLCLSCFRKYGSVLRAAG